MTMKQNPALEASYSTILEITLETLRDDPELKLCEGLRLIEATRVAVSRNVPAELDHFNERIYPQLRKALLDRFGIREDLPS